MKYEEQKNRTMKTFEEIYRDAAVRNGCNAGRTFARVMFEEGMSQNLERCMDRAAGSHTDLMAFADGSESVWPGNLSGAMPPA